MLSDELEAFVTTHLDSVEQCEMLVTMGPGSNRWWTAKELAAELYFSESPTRRDLETLATRGLLEVRLANDVYYRVAPVSAPLTRLASELAGMYRTSRVEILSSIVRRRGRALRHFADAFRFRKGR